MFKKLFIIIICIILYFVQHLSLENTTVNFAFAQPTSKSGGIFTQSTSKFPILGAPTQKCPPGQHMITNFPSSSKAVASCKSIATSPILSLSESGDCKPGYTKGCAAAPPMKGGNMGLCQCFQTELPISKSGDCQAGYTKRCVPGKPMPGKMGSSPTTCHCVKNKME